MDDNKVIPGENQSLNSNQDSSANNAQDSPEPVEENPTTTGEGESRPIFESVPVEEPTMPEEVASDVTEPIPEEVSESSGIPPELPPPVYEESKTKYVVIIFGVVIFLIMLVFIFKVLFGGKSAPKSLTLTYWGLWEDKQIMEPIITQYQQKYPYVKIDYQKMAPQDYREKLLARSKNGQGPDIFRFHNTWLPEISDITAQLPSSIMSNSEFEKTFYKIHQKDLKVGQYYYGIPLTIDGLVMIYNDDLLKKSGIQSPPTSWEDVTNMIPKLTSKDKRSQFINTALAIGTTSNVEHYSDIFALLLVQNGGNVSKLDSQEAAGALEVYRKFSEPGNEYWNDTMPNSLTAFIQEKVAMILAPSWEVLTIKSANPDLKLKVVPVPAGPDGIPVSIANYWVEGVSRYSKNQLEAWKFLRYLVQKENLTKLYQTEAQVRLFGEPYSRVDCASLLTQNEYVGAIMKQAEYFVSVPMISRTFDNGLNDEIIKYVENAINATMQGVSYSEALKTTKQGIDQIFNKYKITTQ